MDSDESRRFWKAGCGKGTHYGPAPARTYRGISSGGGPVHGKMAGTGKGTQVRAANQTPPVRLINPTVGINRGTLAAGPQNRQGTVRPVATTPPVITVLSAAVDRAQQVWAGTSTRTSERAYSGGGPLSR